VEATGPGSCPMKGFSVGVNIPVSYYQSVIIAVVNVVNCSVI
jgi:hypothetical protein